MRAHAPWPARAGVIALALLVASPFTSRPSLAQRPRVTSRAYEAAFKQGTQLFEDGEWAASRIQFQRAYSIDPRPILLFNIASTYRREGRPEEAKKYYVEFLAAKGGDLALEEVARGLIQEIDAARAKAAAEAEKARAARDAADEVGEDEVGEDEVGDDAGEEVGDGGDEDDDVSVGRRPKSALMASGYLGFTASGALFGWAIRSKQRTDELAASGRDGRPDPTSPGLLIVAGAGLTALAVGAVIGAAKLGEPADQPAPLPARWIPWAAISVIAGGVGAFYGIRYRSTSTELANVLAGPEPSLEEVRELEDRAHREALGANISVGIALGALGASISAFFLDRRSAPGDTSLQATIGEHDVGLAIGGRF